MSNFHFDIEGYKDLINTAPFSQLSAYKAKYIEQCINQYDKNDFERIYSEYKHIRNEIDFDLKRTFGVSAILNPYSDDSFNIDKIDAEISYLENQHPELNAKPVKTQKSDSEWTGDKNDLCELIWALWKSERIKDTSTGKTIEREKLISQFEHLFNTDLKNFDDLLRSKLNTYKNEVDKKTFTNELKLVIDERINKKK
jgi:RteC protein